MKKELPAANIVFSTSDEYIHLLSVALMSLTDKMNKTRTYNIYILKKHNVQACAQKLNFLKKYENLNIKFIDMDKYQHLINTNKFYTYGYVSEETYYRFFLPKILNNCPKAIYCDCDIVFCEDIGRLYDLNLHNHIMGAAKNISAIYNYNADGKLPNGEKYRSYFDNILKLKNPETYFQAGISIYNLKKMREQNFTSACLEKLSEIKSPVFFDQDILNALYQDDIEILPMAWNHVWYFWEYDFLENNIPLSLYREYDEARKQPKIVHYAGPKPINERHRPLAGLFWKYAMQTPSFEYFLKQSFGAETHLECVPQNLFKRNKVKPAFGKNQISVMFSSSNTYAPYLGVTIYALTKNMNPAKNYDLLILETSISEVNKEKIREIVAPYKNISLRFINMEKELEDYNYLFYVYPPLSKETYYRLFVDRLCVNYDKMIYIDADTLILSDLCDLDSLDLKDFWVAACKDSIVQTQAKQKIIDRGFNIRYYISNALSLDYKKYAQCGIMILNLKKMREVNFSQKAINMLQYLHNPRFVDQDVINKVCEDHILYLNPKYNFLTFYQDSMIEQVDEEFQLEILHAKKDMRIYHMPGGKPDMFPNFEFSPMYFQYARNTPFYEELVKNIAMYQTQSAISKTTSLQKELCTIHFPNINNHFALNEWKIRLLYVNIYKSHYKLKKLEFKLKYLLSFNAKKKDKYKKKYEFIKKLLKEAKREKRVMF